MTPAVVLEQAPATKEIGTAVKHGFVYGTGGILQKALGFLMLPFYTHYLTPRDFGIWEILNITMSVLGMFLAMGITAGLLRYYGAADSQQEKRTIVSTAYLFVLATGLCAFAAGSLLVHDATLLLFGPGVPDSYLLLMFGFFILGYINAVPVAYLRAKEKSRLLVTLDVGGTFLILALNIYFVAVLKLAISGVLLSQFIITLLSLPLLALWIWRQVGIHINWGLLRKLVSFGAPLVLSNLAMFTLNFSDRFFLQRFRSLEVVGIYSMGYKFGYIISLLLIQPFNMMWMARMYLIYRRSDHQKIFSQIFVLYSSVVIFAALAFALFSPELFAIMVDARYAAGRQVVPLIALAYIFLAMGSYLQLGAFLVSRTDLIGIVSAVAAGSNLLLNYLLIRHFGMMGAAWATVLGFAVLAIGSYYVSQLVYLLDLGVTRVLKALAAAVTIYLLGRALNVQSFPIASLINGSLLAVFTVSLWTAGILSQDDIGTLVSLRKGAGDSMMRFLRPAWLRR